ncbi:nucleoside hydrolase [Saccharopolyspora sp. HNM0983]|uniref:Nucleoside hydrolase n=1 Tax=Saccharopolyspora montiporae TaxID=2781240 RepID=A0A929FX18_9PSEU|nr:nucleoside hydrolase [Saccharopolyspora sp. HNM0983]
MSKKIIIDCDPGIDDALALALAHGSRAVDLVGVTTVAGNVGLPRTTDNALRLADFYGIAAPVARGADRPLMRPPRTAGHVHGETGLGAAQLPDPAREPVAEHAVDFLIESLAQQPGEISLIAVGPLTNIALALRKEPRIAEWAREFVVMGGSSTRGNITPAAEFNVHADPEAAAMAFGADWRAVMAGLDLTHQAQLSAPVRRRFAGLGRLEEELLAPCLDVYEQHVDYREGPVIHDACAVAYAIAPEIFRADPAAVRVETRGEHTSGMTVVDFAAAQPDADVLTTLDTDAFWDLVADALHRVAERLPQV